MSWDKYIVQKKQQYVGGTWVDVSPLQTRNGEKIGTYNTEEECIGYTPINAKFKATYQGGAVYSAECDSNTELKYIQTRPSGYNYSAMTDVVIGSCITTIGWSAFEGCTSLSSVTIPNSVTSIVDEAFISCTSLSSITIPNSVTAITYDSFQWCNSLSSITIPRNVSYIVGNPFNETPSVERINVSSLNTYYDSRGNCNAIIETATNKLIVGCKNTVIPSNVTIIGNSAFMGATGLVNINIPNSVGTIENGAFQWCYNLSSIIIPDSVTNIRISAFEDCSGMTSLTLGYNVSTIGERAFYRCSALTSVTIPSGVTSIGRNAFYGCSGLTSVTFNGTTPPSFGAYTFNLTNNCPIYVPSGSVNAYKTATNFSQYASRIQAAPN